MCSMFIYRYILEMKGYNEDTKCYDVLEGKEVVKRGNNTVGFLCSVYS